MPKIPGRKETRRTVKSTEGLLVASFIMGHEEWLWRRKCVVEGCDHRMGPKTDESGWTDWQPCYPQTPAFVVREQDLGEGGVVGIACPCHVEEIFDR